MENRKYYDTVIVRRPFNERIVIYVLFVICIILLFITMDDWLSVGTIYKNIKDTNETQYVELFINTIIYNNISVTIFLVIFLMTAIYFLICDFKIYYNTENIKIKYFFNKKIYTYNEITEYFLRDSVRIHGRKEVVVRFYDETTIKIMDNYENLDGFIDMLYQNVNK